MLRHWRGTGSARAEEYAGLPAGSVARAAFGVPEFAGTQVGAVTHAQWAAAVGRRLVEVHGPGADAAIPVWLEDRGEVDPAMVELVAAVRRQVPVALVSNATDRLRADLAHHGLLDRFDAVVCSAELGLVKPDRAIFDYAARAVGVAPRQCLFTDDLEVNVAGARAAGLVAVQFTGREALVAALSRHGIGAGAP